MGGFGSGRHSSYSGLDTTEDSLPLDIRKLQRSKCLTAGRSLSLKWSVNDKPVASISIKVEVERVVLAYRHRHQGDSDWQDVEQPIHMEHTPCTYGGTRPWWRCPSCSRRVAILYGLGKLYACRHCCRLAYASQRESAFDRALRRAQSIRKRLGGTANTMEPFPPKPRGMRRRTFERLTAEHDAFAGVSLAGMERLVGILKKRLG